MLTQRRVIRLWFWFAAPEFGMESLPSPRLEPAPKRQQNQRQQAVSLTSFATFCRFSPPAASNVTAVCRAALDNGSSAILMNK
jgi:hypothetical protein